jgi:hypothetical protein
MTYQFVDVTEDITREKQTHVKRRERKVNCIWGRKEKSKIQKRKKN